MNDLISRSVAIEEIWNVFNSYANDNSKFDEYETEAINKAFKVLQNRIEEQPTAFDIEKVVAELEEWTFEADVIMPRSRIIKNNKLISSGNAINIVRKGGIE